MNKISKLIVVAVVAIVAVATLPAKAEKFNEQNKVVSASVTNGQTIVLSAPEMRLTPYGEADGASCTLVVSPSYPIDGLILVTVNHAATNSITLTDATTTLNLGGANRVVKPGQSILLKPVGAAACNMVGGSFFSTAGTVALTLQKISLTDTNGVTASVVTNAMATVTFVVP